jgi:hypothetical protein
MYDETHPYNQALRLRPRRRPKHSDCFRCHRERQRRYREKEKQERQRRKWIVSLLASNDATTRADFDARFTTRWVEVVHKDGSNFQGLVVRFGPFWRVVVQDAAGDLFVAALQSQRVSGVAPEFPSFGSAR